MVRYLKIKVPLEPQPVLSNAPLNSAEQTRTRAPRVSESLKDIQSKSLPPGAPKEPRIKISPQAQHPDKRYASATVISPGYHPENLEKKLHELESKLQDYHEQVRKKETALKLAQQFKNEEIEQQSFKGKSDIQKNKVDRPKHVDFSSLKNNFTMVNALIIFLSIAVFFITTHSFLMLTQHRFEKAFVYRPKLNKKDMNPQMVNRLAAYMTSDRMLAEIIEKLEKLSPDESVRQRQLHDWMIEYRQRIQIHPNPQEGVIQLNIKWDHKDKTVLIARQITDAYLEIMNTQKSIDDYLQYFKKAVERSASFKTRDKVILVNAHQKNLIKDLFVRKQQEYKTQLTNLEEKSAHLGKRLTLAKETKYLSALSRPQSMDDYIIFGLKSRLFDLEAAAFIAQETGSSAVFINDLSKKLQQIRGRIEHLINIRLGQELNPDEKRELYLTMKKMRIEVNKEILSMIMAGQYGLQSDFSINQREYLVNQRKIYKLLHNYSTYTSSKKRLSEIFDRSQAGQNNSFDRKSFSFWKMYQQRVIYTISLGAGLLSGFWLVFFRNKRKAMVSL